MRGRFSRTLLALTVLAALSGAIAVPAFAAALADTLTTGIVHQFPDRF